MKMNPWSIIILSEMVPKSFVSSAVLLAFFSKFKVQGNLCLQEIHPHFFMWSNLAWPSLEFYPSKTCRNMLYQYNSAAPTAITFKMQKD